MSKKSRRARKRTSKAAQPVRLARTAPVSVAPVTPKEIDFSQEYHYVIEDLKRIALTAAALLVLLIVLAVIIA